MMQGEARHMNLTYRLLTPGTAWPCDAAALAAAIRSQGPIQPSVTIEGDQVRVCDRAQGLETVAQWAQGPLPTLGDLAARDGYTLVMTERDENREVPPQRLVRIETAAGADMDTQALFHATVSDGLWWLLGGLLIDPYRQTVWGWRRWRGDQPLAAHAAATVAALAAGGIP